MDMFSRFIVEVAALWVIGSVLSVGLVISRWNKNDPLTWLICLFGIVFSWGFFGWMTGELIALAFKFAAQNRNTPSTQNGKKMFR